MKYIELKNLNSFFPLIVLISFTMTSMVFANTDKAKFAPKILCMTEIPTTSIMAIPNLDETLSIKVFHHNGVNFLPLHFGVITPNDLTLLQQHADLLKSLGEYFEVGVKTDRCLLLDPLNFYCPGSLGDKNISGAIVNVWSVSSGEMLERNFAGEFVSTLFQLNMTINGKSLFMTMKYEKSLCTSEFSEFSFQ